MKLMTNVLKKWPAEAKRFEGKREARRRERPADSVTRQTHRWEYADEAWRCRVCKSSCFAEFLPENRKREECKGGEQEVVAGGPQTQGHTVCTTSCTGMAVYFCVKCGAWAMRRKYNLKRACTGIPTPAGKQALIRIAKGKHPWVARGGREEDRGGIEVVDPRRGELADNHDERTDCRDDGVESGTIEQGGAAAEVQAIAQGSGDGAAMSSAPVAKTAESRADAADAVAGRGKKRQVEAEEEEGRTDGAASVDRPSTPIAAVPRQSARRRTRAAAVQRSAADADRREYLMAASMASHAERVQKRRALDEVTARPPCASVKERMEALRRRVAVRTATLRDATRAAWEGEPSASQPVDEIGPGGGGVVGGESSLQRGVKRRFDAVHDVGGGYLPSSSREGQ